MDPADAAEIDNLQACIISLGVSIVATEAARLCANRWELIGASMALMTAALLLLSPLCISAQFKSSGGIIHHDKASNHGPSDQFNSEAQAAASAVP